MLLLSMMSRFKLFNFCLVTLLSNPQLLCQSDKWYSYRNFIFWQFRLGLSLSRGVHLGSCQLWFLSRLRHLFQYVVLSLLVFYEETASCSNFEDQRLLNQEDYKLSPIHCNSDFFHEFHLAYCHPWPEWCPFFQGYTQAHYQ